VRRLVALALPCCDSSVGQPSSKRCTPRGLAAGRCRRLRAWPRRTRGGWPITTMSMAIWTSTPLPLRERMRPFPPVAQRVANHGRASHAAFATTAIHLSYKPRADAARRLAAAFAPRKRTRKDSGSPDPLRARTLRAGRPARSTRRGGEAAALDAVTKLVTLRRLQGQLDTAARHSWPQGGGGRLYAHPCNRDFWGRPNASSSRRRRGTPRLVPPRSR
jgi:hypothetical protein